MSTVYRKIQNQIEFSLKLIRHEPADCISQQQIEARCAWARHLEDTKTHLTDCQRATIVRFTQRSRNLSLMVAVAREGILLQRLPPYTPQLNATEYVKPHVRLQDFDDQETLIDHIQNGLDRITPDKCFGWIGEVNRNRRQILERQPLGCLNT
ncbi:hypothetical protein BG003_002940 [Podila horticola]|nr:hypothetical protein BG003_002940 [Podila horticola]